MRALPLHLEKACPTSRGENDDGVSSRRLFLRPMRFVPSLLVPFALVAVGACGPAPVDAVPVQLTLALEFGSDALLEVFVLDEAAAACPTLMSGDKAPGDDGVPFHDVRRTPASRLNAGGSARLDFSELPAEVPLVFYARALDASRAIVSDACDGDVRIPNGGHIDVQLTLVER